MRFYIAPATRVGLSPIALRAVAKLANAIPSPSNTPRRLEIADVFGAEAPRLMATMEDASRAGDAGALRSAAHALRGSAGNFMAKETVDAALRLEMAAGQGDLVLAGSVLDGLKGSVERLTRELAQLRDPDGAGR